MSIAEHRQTDHKEAEVARTTPSSQTVQGNIRHCFVFRTTAFDLKSSESRSLATP
jgi:hypothetical protein